MKTIFIILWFVPAIYLCVGGVANILVTDDLESSRLLPENARIGKGDVYYRNKAEQNATQDYHAMIRFYPLYSSIGTTLCYLFNLMAFGILGSLVRIMLRRFSGRKPFPNESLIPMFGIIVGFIVIVIDEFLPDFKYQSGKEKFYFSMALLGGIYSSELFNWLGKRFGAFLTDEKEARQTL
jgi:hypothetical protein